MFPDQKQHFLIVHFEPIENRIGIEQAEPFHNVKISVRPVHAAGVPVEAAGVVEVRRVHH